MNGFLCINKPCGPSSFHIVHQVRRSLSVKKAGHAGTLDPRASGVLVIAIGSATRLLQYLPNEPKVYRFGIQFGVQTDSFDAEGEITRKDGRIPDESEILEVLPDFSGNLMQIPPAFSAVKIGGVRSYAMARAGKKPVLPPRPVTIFKLQLLSYDKSLGLGHFEVSCSGGTYVRALTRDIAQSLGTIGFASSIERIASGQFTIDKAINADKIQNAGTYIIPPEAVFRNLPEISVSETQMQQIMHGNDISVPDFDGGDSTVVFAYYEKNIIAVLHRKTSIQFHPVTVFTSGEVT